MATHIVRSHVIEVAGSGRDVLDLLTPRGEERWIAEWRPDYIEPPSGETREGMVFRTGAGDDLTLWCCVVWDPDDLHARYARVTPAARFGLVDVRCRALARDRTSVTVRYEYTALTPAGAAGLDALSETAFAAMIEGWRRDLDRVLAGPPA